MYVVSPFPNFLFALDLARGGQVRWKFDTGKPIRAQPKVIAGDIYVTDFANRQVWLVKPSGEKRVVDTGLEFANGLMLTPGALMSMTRYEMPR